MTESEHVAIIVVLGNVAQAAATVAAVVVSRLMSRGEHKETQDVVQKTNTTVQQVHDIVRNGQGKEKHP